MVESVVGAFVEHPELSLFLALAIGYAVGKISFGSFTLGSVTGCLLAGVLIGQTGVVVSKDVQQAFFLLFLFAIGYRTGPQFFRSLNARALPQIAVTIVLCVVALAVVLLLAPLLGLDLGIAAGLLAGAATESATVGVAIDAFHKTGPAAEAARLFDAQIATGFAVAYLVGVIATILMHSQVAPRFFGRSLKDACAEMEEELGASSGGGRLLPASARREVEARAFRLDERWVGKAVKEVEATVPPQAKAYVEQLRREDEIIEVAPDTRFEAGDIVCVAGLRGFIVEHAGEIGTEVDDVGLLDVPVDIIDVVVTSSELAGKRLRDLRRMPEARAVFLRRVLRAGQEVPSYPGLVVQKGDVLTIAGSRQHVAEAAEVLGYPDRPTSATDMVYVALFIVAGGLFGIPALKLGALELGLGIAVGVLIGGLVAGWLRSIKRTFGFVPEATLWLFDSVGLCAFIACVGISAGPSFVQGLVPSGPALVIVSIIVVVLAHGAALFVGRKIFKMNEGVLAGTCCGAGTSAAVQEIAESRVPTLGYGLGYAIGNVLLAVWGSVLVIVLGS